MDFFLQQTSIEQNLTATETAMEEEEVTEQGLGNHHTEYQHLHTHTSQQTMASNHGGAALQKDGSTVSIR